MHVATRVRDTAVAQPLWERYHRQLIGLARQKLRMTHRRQADEEDIVQNAFHSFFRGVSRGRFPELGDRDNLWRLLVLITARKALDQVTYDRQKCRAGRTVSPGSRITNGDTDWGTPALEQIVGDEPTPEFAAQVAEQYRRLLELLDEPSLEKVAVWKMEGLTNDEIAARLNCSRRSVARKLETIRIIWSEDT